jgi:aminoglycoside phosphotransferase (APT) family kinase protein
MYVHCLQVYKEYRILVAAANKSPSVPTPKPIHCSTEDERRVVGTKFIIMSFVEGNSYPNASSVPSRHRRTAFSSVMKELAGIHSNCCWHWLDGNEKITVEYTRSSQFWESQVTCWQNNYDAASRRCLGYGSYGNQRNSTDRFFDTMARATMRSDGEASELMSS